MARDQNDKLLDELVARDMFGGAPDFSDDDIQVIRENPGLLRKLTDPLEVKKRYIYVLLSIALFLAAMAKVFEYTGVFGDVPVAHDLLTNVLFSVAIELFGAAVVAFLMELVFEKRVQRNRELVEALAGEFASARVSDKTK
ncbi:MAG: hypothetical protein LCH36_03390 [Actinobacteria bacterium]|mgnify:CR=1 FL=1|jgi:hypothetical protein|nr:hypothetical protein [Actinomycetota bacterium]